MGISFNNIRIGVIHKSSGIFVGTNIQQEWCSTRAETSSFGRITGKMNRFEQPVNISVSPDTDPETVESVLKQHSESGVYKWSG